MGEGEAQAHFFGKWLEGDHTDDADRIRLIDWLAEQALHYESTLRDVIGDHA